MGEPGHAGAEGATAPETLRHMYRQERGLWRECSGEAGCITEEVSRRMLWRNLSGTGTEGASIERIGEFRQSEKGACK